MKSSVVAGPLAASGLTGRSTSLLLAGASFKSSSLGFRESLAQRLSRDPSTLLALPGVKELAQLVTCNRIEVFLASESPAATEQAVLVWMSAVPGYARSAVYLHRDFEAVLHLFSVAAGLDSMVVGEDQILSQVREAGIAARTSSTSRGSLSALFDASVNVGKRSRRLLQEPTESVSSVSIRHALALLPSPPKNVLLIGTGKTSRLAASLVKGAKLFVATRRKTLPFPGAKVVSHRDLKRVASRCELIVSATRHQGYVLRRGDITDKRRVIVDLAFPRNIDPGLKSESTVLLNLEDLAKVVPKKPLGVDARAAEEWVAAEAESFSRWLLASRQSDVLSQVYRWAETTREEEAKAALRRLPRLTVKERKVVETMSRRLVSKLLAPPTSFAKASTPEFPQQQRLDIMRLVFEQGEG